MDNFLNLMHLNISILEKQKKILLQYVLKISDYPSTNLSINSSNKFVEFLSIIKDKISLADENLSIAYDYIDKMKNSNILFDEYTNISSNISNCIIDIEDFFISSMNFIDLNFDETIVVSDNNESTIKDSPSQTVDNSNSDLLENTLIISETQGKVFLPYTIENLKSILEENTKYQNFNEAINDNFVIPYANFKNPIFSRFKEAFKLIKLKEHGSVKEALDLGMELLLNYNLHPAIISACKNIDELDIYLDCLENNETDKFDCFDIKFEIPPSLKK